MSLQEKNKQYWLVDAEQCEPEWRHRLIMQKGFDYYYWGGYDSFNEGVWCLSDYIRELIGLGWAHKISDERAEFYKVILG